MSLSGIVVANELVAGTDWCLRDPLAWWSRGLGTRQRAKVVDLHLGHWTAGEAGTFDPDGPEPLTVYDDDGPRVVRGMRARINKATGRPLNAGVHFVIGACDPAALYAPVWQTADFGLIATVSVGRGDVNARAIATEVVSAGLPGRGDVRARPRSRVELLGATREVLAFYPGQIRSWVRLSETLASIRSAGIAIPRRVPPFGASRRFEVREMAAYAGGLEHLHVPGTTKIDAGGLLTDALFEAGWS